jgi:hypothetical protein
MSFSDKAYSEKRDFIRMTISASLNAKLSAEQGDIAGQIIEGKCRNLSGGGMLVVVSQDLPVNTELNAEVSSEHGHNPTLKARVRVARNLPMDEGQFELGLEIIEVIP